mmetsp:Transcript_9498/g.28682  ORF Transcript_9498/g.28682 Transcript_9498/m.28682 type:complete len:781 (+) Transcript_9498:145-2487(+)
MGSSQSSAGRGFSPYSADSPTRDFVSGSHRLEPEPKTYWSSLFQEYLFLRTSTSVPRSLLRSLDAAIRSLTRALGRPDHVDAYNVSVLFRVTVSLTKTFMRSRLDGEGERSPNDRAKDDMGSDLVRGAVSLMTAVTIAFVQSGAGRDRIYLVLGASDFKDSSDDLNARPWSSDGRPVENNGDLLMRGELVASSVVETLCECLATLSEPEDGNLKIALISALVTFLSARLYTDRSLPTQSIAFVPFFDDWAARGSNSVRLVSSLVHNIVSEASHDKEHYHKEKLLTSMQTPEALIAPQTEPTMSFAGAQFLSRLRMGRYSSRTSSADEDEASTGALHKAPSEILSEEASLARSSILFLLLLLYGTDLNGGMRFQSALELLSENVDEGTSIQMKTSASTFVSIAEHWMPENCGILFVYTMFLCSPKFRLLFTERLIKDGVHSPLYQLLHELSDQEKSTAHFEAVYIPLTVLEMFLEDDRFCAELDNTTLPLSSLTEDLELCTAEEAKSICDPDTNTVRFSLVVLLIAVQCAHVFRSDLYLLTLSVTIVANLSSRMNNVVCHAAWSAVTLLDSLSLQYRNLVTDSTSDASEDETDENDWEDNFEDPSKVLSIMVEAIASMIFGRLNDEKTHIRNVHVLHALLRMRESIFDADSGVTLMVMKNRDASAHCRIACSRLNNILGQAQLFQREHGDLLENDISSEDLQQKITLLPLQDQPEGFQPATAAPKFRYVENTEAHDFLGPFVWSIAHGRSSLDPVDSNMRFLAFSDLPWRDANSPSVPHLR